MLKSTWQKNLVRSTLFIRASYEVIVRKGGRSRKASLVEGVLMKNDNQKEIYIAIAAFVIGAISAVVFMVNNYPSNYQGKTAQEWNTEYTQAESKINLDNQVGQLPDPFQGLISCLANLPKYTDYYNGVPYHTEDVSDVNQCIGDSRQQQYDNWSSIQDQQNSQGN